MTGIWLTLIIISIASATLMASFGARQIGNTLKGKTICALLGVASAATTLALMFISVSAGSAWAISVSLLVLATMAGISLRRSLKSGDGQTANPTDLTALATRECENRLGPAVRQTIGITRSTWKVGAVGLLIPAVALFSFCAGETVRISQNSIPPWDSQPWKEGLTARVYWSKEPSPEARAGFEATATLFGVPIRYVESESEANLRIWPETKFTGQCKLGAAAAFSSPDPITGDGGLESGDIYICRWTLPPDKPPLPDNSLMAHETAHLLGAVPHFGEGLMAHMGGNGSWWFSEEEVQCMLYRVNEYQKGKAGAAENSGKDKQGTNVNGQVPSDCPPPPRF